MHRSIQENWGDFRDRLRGHGRTASGTGREARIAYLSKRYGLTREEALRCLNERKSDDGSLDDWNDTRAILDM